MSRKLFITIVCICCLTISYDAKADAASSSMAAFYTVVFTLFTLILLLANWGITKKLKNASIKNAKAGLTTLGLIDVLYGMISFYKLITNMTESDYIGRQLWYAISIGLAIWIFLIGLNKFYKAYRTID